MNIQAVINKSSETVLNCAFSGGIGYLCARAFTAINPVHAAVACAVSALVSKVTAPVFEAVFSGPGSNNASKMLGSVLNITVSVAVSLGIATALGFPVSLPSFLCLNAVIVASVVAFAFSAIALTVAGVMLENAISRN